MRKLSDSETESFKEAYVRDGVIRVKGLFSREEVAGIEEALEQYSETILPGLPQSDYVMEKDGSSIRNLWRMEKHAPFFQALTEREEILSLVARLVNGGPVSCGVETFNKPARTGSGVPPHQDNAYFCMKPPDMLTVWIAIDPATEGNGPVSYMTGSHEKGILPHKPSGVSGNSMGLAKVPSAGEYPVFVGTLDKGDALIHHCEVIHYSAPNRTDQSRCGLLMVFKGEHTQRDEALHKEYMAAQASA